MPIINKFTNIKITTEYKLTYTLSHEINSLEHSIDLNTSWMQPEEIKQVYLIAFRENLKQMQKINKSYIEDGSKPLYKKLALTEHTIYSHNNVVLAKRTVILKEEKLNKEFTIKNHDNTINKIIGSEMICL
jgi:hypothetical protein